MKKVIIISVIVLVIIIIAVFLYVIIGQEISSSDTGTGDELQGRLGTESPLGGDDTENKSQESNTAEDVSEISGVSGGGGGGGGGGSGEETQELPADIEDVGCGFYAEDYGVCTGTCPSGECVQEGRSCYCKKS